MGADLPSANTPYVSITSFGAISDGITNNQVAIQNAFDYAAANGDAVYIPTGNFAYSGTLNASGIAVFGAGMSSILTPLDVTNEALTLTGSGGSVSNLQMDSSASARLTTYQSSMIWVDNAQDYTVQNVLINGSSCVGIFDDGGQKGLIQNNTVENTLADSITNTNGASNTTITANLVVNSGDDGISNVSYVGSPIVQGITIQGNTVINNNWGRGISVVGGSNIQITGNYVDNQDLYSDVYIAAESQYATLGVNNVTVSGNTLVDGGPNQGTVTVYNSQGSAYNIDGVAITGNQIVNPANDAFQFCGNGSETVVLQNNTGYTNSSYLTGDSNPLAVISSSNNTILNPASYTTPLVSPGGGVTTTPTPTPTPTPTAPSPAVITVPASQTSVTVAVNDATINATSGSHLFFISGSADTFHFGGGIETVTESGAGGNTFDLPVAGHGSAIFNAAALMDGDVFDLTAALAGTSWNGSTKSLASYLHTTQSGGNTKLLVSASALRSASGTLLATFDNQKISLSTMLAHAII